MQQTRRHFFNSILPQFGVTEQIGPTKNPDDVIERLRESACGNETMLRSLDSACEFVNELAADEPRRHRAELKALAKAAPAMLAALRRVMPLLDQASKAYQFGPTAYTYEALMACMNARDIAMAAIAEAEDVDAVEHEEEHGK